MRFERMDSAGYLLNHVARLFYHQLRRRIAPLGLVPGQFPVLLALWEEDGLTQKALLELVDIEQATLAATLQRMERDGLIFRKRDPDDARAQRIYLTDKARSLRDDAHAAAQGVNAAALAGLTDEEQRRLLGYMRRIIETMRAAE